MRISRIGAGREAARNRAERSGVHLSRPAINLISALHASGPMRLSRLSDLTDLEAPLVSREIARLCEGGYVKRAADPTDGRATIVDLSAKGRKAYTSYRQATDDIVVEAFASLEGGRAAHPRRLPRAGRPRRESPSGFRIGSLPWSSNSGDVMPAPLVKIDLEFPYTRSVGPVIGAYLDGLEAGRLLASRAGDRTLSPPLEYDPATGASVEPELVEVGPEGVVTSWTWVDAPNPNHPLDRPFAFALIQLDGADTAMVHVVDGRRIDAVSTGMRVAAAWRDERTGYVDRHRVLRGGPREPRRTRPRKGRAIMPFPVALHYEELARRSLDPLRRGADRRQDHRAASAPASAAWSTCRRKDYLPHRRDRAHRPTTTSSSATPARSPTSRSSRRCSTTARRRPSRSSTRRSLLDGRRRHAAAPGGARHPGRRRARRHARRRGVAPGGGAQHRRARSRWWGSADGGIEGWMPTGEPDGDVSALPGKGY